MQTWKPMSVWAVAASVSVAVNLAALVAGGAAWAERPEPRKAAPPLLSHRDVTFLMGYVREAAKAIRAEAAVAGEAKPTPQDDKARETRALPPTPVSVPAPGAVPVAAPPPPAPKPAKPPEPAPAPEAPEPAREEPPFAIDAGLVEALVATDSPTAPNLDVPQDKYQYGKRLRDRIARNCQFLWEQRAASARGVVWFHVVVHRSGGIQEILYRQHSDDPALDLLAEQAILRSAPFPPFYQAMDMKWCAFGVPIRLGSADRQPVSK